MGNGGTMKVVRRALTLLGNDVNKVYGGERRKTGTQLVLTRATNLAINKKSIFNVEQNGSATVD